MVSFIIQTLSINVDSVQQDSDKRADACACGCVCEHARAVGACGHVDVWACGRVGYAGVWACGRVVKTSGQHPRGFAADCQISGRSKTDEGHAHTCPDPL